MRTDSPAAGSGIPARGLSGTDRATRGVTHAKSYGLGLRIADNVHGFWDARRSEAPLAALPWPGRLQATYAENAARSLAGTRDVLAPQVRLVHAGRLELAVLDEHLAGTEAELDATRAAAREPGHGERHLPAQAIADRSEHAADVRRERLRAEITDLRRRRDQLRQELAAAEASVLEEFGAAAEVVRRLREFYQRRLQTYARRFLARREDVSTLDHLIELPAWATEPCPWLEPMPAPAPAATVGVLHAVA